MMKKHVDFLVIGAQKAGTTSLHRYLSIHPDIYLPIQKEVAFFSHDVAYARGVEVYLSRHFSASRARIVGEASPQYMCYDKCPSRIYRHFPAAKLIAVLRNPIDRAYSHYRMSVRRGRERRSFEESIVELLRRGPVPDEERNTDHEYVSFGEYGRILGNYLQYFDIGQLHIVWSDDLDRVVSGTLMNVFSFLGVDSTVNSPVFKRRYHQGGKKRFPPMVDSAFRKLLNFWSRFSTGSTATAMKYWYETEFNVRPIRDAGPGVRAREMLQEYYKEDVFKLERTIACPTPWDEFHRIPPATMAEAQESSC